VLEQERLELLRQRDYAASDAAVEEWAHREAKMVRDGEVLVIPIPGNLVIPTAAPPPPVFLPTPVPEPGISRWRLWWNLFFDGEPPF